MYCVYFYYNFVIFLSLKLNILGFTKGLCLNIQIFAEFSFYLNSSLLKFLCSIIKIVRSRLSDNIILLDLFCITAQELKQ